MSRKGRLSRISSFSSEDPNHPANNLLAPETFRKWKCKEAGEKAAFVIIQLDKVEKIMSIDIGNENSAFIEVSVARSGADNPEFEVIQNQTAFMTASESKAETNPNRVKMFSGSLVKSVTAEKWDLIKISCIQPFNRHIQFGISFINVIVEPDTSEAVKIGGFHILQKTPVKDELDVVDDPIRIGSFFAKRMEASGHSIKAAAEKPPVASTPSTLAATIRGMPASSTGSTLTQIDNKTNEAPSDTSKLDVGASSRGDGKDTSKVSGIVLRKQFSNQVSGSGVPSPKGLSTNSKASSSGTTKGADVNKIQCPSGSPQPSCSSTRTKPTGLSLPLPSSSTSSTSKSPLKRKKKLMKPFNKLFEDVVFVMSGFENPYRSDLRRRAVEMGAQCKPDWNSTCTHLICAFVNTPKFRQVKGSRNGKIVTKKWIEDSHRKKCRFPWRRYCLDKADKGDESEEEVHALGDIGESSDSDSEESDEGYTLAVDVLNSQESGVVMDQDGEGDDTPDAEGEDDDNILISPRSTKGKLSNGRAGSKRRRIARISSSSSSSDDAAYDVDTEVDEPQVSPAHTNDSRISNTESNHPRHNKYNDFFNSKLFFLYPTQPLHPDQRNEIEQIIHQHKGSLATYFSQDVDYVVTGEMKWIEEFSQLLSQNPDVVVVGDSWIQKCGEANEMVLPEPFIIPPE